MKTLKTLLAAACLAALATSLAPAADKKVIPYPLKVCLVQDEKLDDKPFTFVYKGREIKFCCDSCKPEFDKDPAKYIKKLEAAEKKLKK